MAKEGERSAPADKGKGKVDDIKDLAGGKKDKPEEKTQASGKQKDDEPQEGTQLLCSLDTRHPRPLDRSLTTLIAQRSLVRRINN
jgi:hypothetical protein